MDKLLINGVTFNSFGKNALTHGMEMITLTYPPKDLVSRVLAGEFRGVFLNPSAKCNSFEFYGVFGTIEQYQEFYASQVDAQIAKKMLDYFDLPIEQFRAKREEFEKSYKDWWEE